MAKQILRLWFDIYNESGPLWVVTWDIETYPGNVMDVIPAREFAPEHFEGAFKFALKHAKENDATLVFLGDVGEGEWLLSPYGD